jgi:hypothetical protein
MVGRVTVVPCFRRRPLPAAYSNGHRTFRSYNMLLQAEELNLRNFPFLENE